MALTVTAAGGLCLFAGVLLLGHIVGSYDLDRVLASGDLIRAAPLYLPTLILILLGALTKSAQFPFHFWLPHAMAAPTPGLGLPAFGDDGEGRRVPAARSGRCWPAPTPGSGSSAPPALHAAPRRLRRDLPAAT